eukprot:TRINITY_DN915_c0_g1_i1.p1 TRINITY_DN915_c0_g1~~TRINITY_DN915_c0_g1_i1.p1  ORF type:complete len:463 (+),score=161.70 TRINITY_DN915_c0_g1_i1:77-1465(+)
MAFSAPLPSINIAQIQGGGMHFDPQYHYWYNNFAWWYYGGENSHFNTSTTDPKVSKVAFSLAGLIVKDRMPKTQMEKISACKPKMFDFALDGELAAYFESVGVRLEIIKPQDVIVFLTNHKLPPNQIVILNGLLQPAKELMTALSNFVSDGGRLLIFNTSSQVISSMFPGKIGTAPPSTLISSRIRLTGKESELFTSLKDMDEIDLEYQRHPIEITDKQEVTVLVEALGRKPEPLILQWNYGPGSVYLFLSKLFLHERKKLELITADGKKKDKKVEIKSENQSQPKEDKQDVKMEEQSQPPQAQNTQVTPSSTDTMDIEIKKEEGVNPPEPTNNGNEKNAKKTQNFQHKKKKNPQPAKKQKKGPVELPEDFHSYLSSLNASEDTTIAWKCAINVGLIDGYHMAKRVLPSLEMIGKILAKEQEVVETMFVPPPYEDQPDGSTSDQPQQQEQQHQNHPEQPPFA